MKSIKTIIITAALAVFGGLALAPTATVAAYNPLEGACSQGSQSELCTKKDEELEPVLKTVINVLLYIIGAVSVLVIIIAGISYATSGGDSGKVTKAKNTLLYAVVGLLVAFFAFAIVNWVLDRFK